MKTRLTSLLFTSSFFLLPFSFAFAYDIHTKALTPIAEDAKPAGAEMKFVENGKINFVVVADLKTEGHVRARSGYSIAPAIQELTNAFVRCFGAAPAVYDWREVERSARGADPIKGKYILYLGDQPAVHGMGIDFRSLPSQGYRIATFKNGLVIVGNDSSLIPSYNVEKYDCLGTSPGTLNGVLDFCERFLEVRWYFPGPYGSLFPAQKDLVIAPVAYTDGPYFNERQEPYTLVSQTLDEKARAKWSKYFGYQMREGESSFSRYYRIGGTIPPVGMHNPEPATLIRNFPDKTKLIFYTSPSGHHYCNAKNTEQCYFNVFDLKFADFLVDELYKPYFASKGKIDKGRLSPYVSKGYISFGQCDLKLPETDWKNDPTVKALGLKSMADVYCRFQQYLAKRIEEEFPGTRLFVLAYYDQSHATEDPRWKLPENFDVMLCAGSLPRRTRRPDQLVGLMDRFRKWYEASGNHPISKIWLYTDYTNPFSVAVMPEFIGEVPQLLGKYMGRDGCFFDCGGTGAIWHYFWATYASYRAQWNPKLDVDAAIDDCFDRCFGAESSAHFKEFHRIIKKAYLDHYLNGRDVYPLEITDATERELKAAGACLAKDSVEYKRWQIAYDYWPKAFAQQRLRAAYKPPVYSAPELKAGETIKVDGVAEAAWESAPVMKLADCADPTKKSEWPTVAKMRWDAKGLYVLAHGDWEALVTPAEDMWKANDLIELFLMPGTGREVNHQIVWDFTGRSYSWKRRFLPVIQPGDYSWKPAGLLSKTTYGNGQWTFEAFVPWTAFDAPDSSVRDAPRYVSGGVSHPADSAAPKKGERWNIYLARDKTTKKAPAYEPVDLVGSAFTMGNHMQRDMYGFIEFK